MRAHVEAAGENEATGADTVLARYDQELREYFAELEELGVYYKDWSYTVGLADFPAIIEGETVFLCWRSDEDRLSYYHRIEDGYAGRKSIPTDWNG